jgi:TRAP-type C4-dicarboxylate transport system permease small subunit
VRKTLDRLYDGCQILAAICMVALFLTVLLSIVSRELHFMVRGIDAYAGYFMAGAGFFALAHTLKRGEHIRVNLILQQLQGKWLHRVEMGALSGAVLLAGLLAFFSARLCWQSFQFNDVSTGNDATPLWIPQLSMVIGTLVFLLALCDEWWLELKGQRTQASNELSRTE